MPTAAHPTQQRDGGPRICLICIGDEPLRQRARKAARRVRCRYCESTRAGVSIATLAALVDDYLRLYCCIGETVRRYELESDDSWYEQVGEPLTDLLQEELGIEPDAAGDLAGYLEEHDPACPGDGEDPFYASDQAYHRYALPSSAYAEAWEEFAQRVKHERRFFDAGATARLEDILGAPGSAKLLDLPVLEIGPDKEVSSVFRARTANSESHAQEMLRSPATEVGPPPRHKATAGRMNSAGISVFYGALTVDTAVAEVRPSVGSLVVLARFAPIRVLRLLDLSQIGAGFTGSIFAPDYADRVARLAFLQGFHGRIARPVRPGEEPIAYVPTQVVAEYVANVLGFDGLLYASVQVGALPTEDPWDRPDFKVRLSTRLTPEELGRYNVVLLGPAGRVSPALGTIVNANAAELTDSARFALRCEDNSAQAKYVTAIAYSHEAAYLLDTDRPFGSEGLSDTDMDIADF